jgi:NTP pyrophosphatase (non-canonical NTP hydrolase)
MNYREEVMRTAGVSLENDSFRDQLLLGATGLAGEGGEVVDLIKKHVFHGKELKREDLIKELGDVRWYMEYLMLANKVTIQEVEAANVAKLRARYPDGFNHKDANERKDEKTPG